VDASDDHLEHRQGDCAYAQIAKGVTMNIRKIAAVGSFAAGAALALAPIASADDLTSTISSEESALNGIFQLEASFAGVPSGDYFAPVDGFDGIKLADVAHDAPATAPFTTLDYELFGVNPALAGVTSDPGSLDLFNGALAEFANAYNIELYSMLNPSADIASIPIGELFGSEDGINEALATGTASLAAGDFLTTGWSDLLGYFGVFGM
jgi:hypothetical protein